MLDLRIRGRKALVCAASKGLGRACAMALGRAGSGFISSGALPGRAGSVALRPVILWSAALLIGRESAEAYWSAAGGSFLLSVR